MDHADLEFLLPDLQTQMKNEEVRARDAETRVTEYVKARIEALEKDFIQSRLADRVADLEATSGQKVEPPRG